MVLVKRSNPSKIRLKTILNCPAHDFEYQVILLLDWLLTMVREIDLYNKFYP